VSTPAVRVLVSLLSPFALALASRDYTFDGSAFYVLFQNVSGIGLGFGFTFRAYVYG